MINNTSQKRYWELNVKSERNSCKNSVEMQKNIKNGIIDVTNEPYNRICLIHELN